MGRLTAMELPMVDARSRSNWDDETLMCRVRDDGDLDAFETLVHRYQVPARRIFISYFGRSEDIEDLVQELFLKIFQNRNRYRSHDKFRAWFYRIALNLAHDEWRKRTRRKRRYFQFFLHMKREYENPDRYAQDSGIIMGDTVDLLEKFIHSLPPRQKQILILRYVEDMSLNEIAEMLGLKLGSVKSTLHHAQNKLKECMSKYIQAEVT